MLIRFRFSSHCTIAVQANYERLLHIGYYGTHALLECRESEVIGDFADLGGLDIHAIKGLMARMHRLGDKNLPMLVQNCPGWDDRAPLWFKALIRQRDDGGYMPLVWGWIQTKQELCIVGESCCLAPVDSLKFLWFGEEMSMERAQELASDVNAGQTVDEMVCRDVALLYMVIFWEARESVIAHYFSRLTLIVLLITRLSVT